MPLVFPWVGNGTLIIHEPLASTVPRPPRPSLQHALLTGAPVGLASVLLVTTRTGRDLLAGTSLPLLAVGLPFGLLLVLLLLVRATARVRGTSASVLAWLQLLLGTGTGFLAGPVVGGLWHAVLGPVDNAAPSGAAVLVAGVALSAAAWSAWQAAAGLAGPRRGLGRAAGYALVGLLAVPLLPWYLVLADATTPLLFAGLAGDASPGAATAGLWLIAGSLALGVLAAPVLGRAPRWRRGLARAVGLLVGAGLVLGHLLYLVALPAVGRAVGGGTAVPGFNYVPLALGVVAVVQFVRGQPLPASGFTFRASR